MSCRQIKTDIALWVGNDLPDGQRRDELKRHVRECRDCHNHARRLQSTLVLLEQADRLPTYEVSDSLWPGISRRIARPQKAMSLAASFGGWLPLTAVAAACCVLAVAVYQPGNPSSPVPSSNMPRSVLPMPTVPRPEPSTYHEHFDAPEYRYPTDSAPSTSGSAAGKSRAKQILDGDR